jgi:hypothetical protein
MKLVSARRKDASPNNISFDKHLPFTDRTQRSAWEFKLSHSEKLGRGGTDDEVANLLRGGQSQQRRRALSRDRIGSSSNKAKAACPCL